MARQSLPASTNEIGCLEILRKEQSLNRVTSNELEQLRIGLSSNEETPEAKPCRGRIVVPELFFGY